jgi:phage protein D
MEIMRLIIGLATLALSTSLFAATIYTWVDDAGVVHYSQQHPLNVDARKIYSEDMEPAKIGTYTPQKKSSTKVETELETSAKIINEKDKQQAKNICESAKHSLSVLKTHSKLNQQNKDTGETVAMTEEQRQAAIAENTERVSLFCQSK